MCGSGMCAWSGEGMHGWRSAWQEGRALQGGVRSGGGGVRGRRDGHCMQRTLRILLECILVIFVDNAEDSIAN